MTIDEAIVKLQEARQQLGGAAPLWVNQGGEQIKWEEQVVDKVEFVDDGESRYVRLVVIPES